MPRSSREVGAAWGRLVGVAVDACKSHHTADCDCERTVPFIPGAGRTKKKGPGEEPDGVIDSIGMSPVQHCDPATTGHKGELVVTFEQQSTMTFGDVNMFFLKAGEGLATAPVNGQTYPPQIMGPGTVTVTIDPQLPRGLYVGHSQTTGGAMKPVLIYIDDVL